MFFFVELFLIRLGVCLGKSKHGSRELSFFFAYSSCRHVATVFECMIDSPVRCATISFINQLNMSKIMTTVKREQREQSISAMIPVFFDICLFSFVIFIPLFNRCGKKSVQSRPRILPAQQHRNILNILYHEMEYLNCL